jgi:V8-like Glu-specific endopeptidase
MGRFGGGHACPIEPRIALTNAHVVDPRPFDESVMPFGAAYSDGVGHAGFLIPIRGRLETLRDLAAVEPLTAGVVFADPFRVASEAPKPGDRVWVLGYSWKNRKSALDEDVIDAHVTRVVALHVEFYPSGEVGSSGSCVLNAAGEVVAINSGAWPTDDHSKGGHAVGVWGALARMPE